MILTFAIKENKYQVEIVDRVTEKIMSKDGEKVLTYSLIDEIKRLPFQNDVEREIPSGFWKVVSLLKNNIILPFLEKNNIDALFYGVLRLNRTDVATNVSIAIVRALFALFNNLVENEFKYQNPKTRVEVVVTFQKQKQLDVVPIAEEVEEPELEMEPEPKPEPTEEVTVKMEVEEVEEVEEESEELETEEVEEAEVDDEIEPEPEPVQEQKPTVFKKKKGKKGGR